MLWVIFLPYIVKTLKWYSLIDIIFFLLVAVTWKYTDIVKINPFVMTPGKESRELLQSRFMDFSYVSIWDFMCQNFVFLYLSAVCAHVGVEDPHIIPNAQITSSSYYLRYYPHIGRLNEVKGWCQRTTAITGDYIQVDKRALHTVCAIATEGKKNGSLLQATSCPSPLMKAAGSYIRDKTLTRFEIILLIFSILVRWIYDSHMSVFGL